MAKTRKRVSSTRSDEGSTVHVVMKRTIQVREYEPLVIEIGIEAPVGPGESLGEVYDRVSEFVGEKLSEECNAVEEQLE